MYLLTEILVALFIVIVVAWLIWRKRKLSMFKRLGIPGPEPNFWTGNLDELNNNKNMEKYLIDKYGKIVGFYVGPRPYLIVSDPELLKIIQVKEFKNFVNKDLIFPDMGVPLKCMTESMEVAKDDKWRNSRQCLNAAFSTGKIKCMLTTINEAVNTFMKKVEESNSEPVDFMDMFRRLTFDVMCRISCEISSNIQNNEKNTFTDSLEYIFQFGTSRILDTISMCFPEFEPIPTRLRWIKDSIRTFFNLPSAGIISKTCQNIINSKKQHSESQTVNLLQLMLNANQNPENRDNDDESEGKSKKITLSDESVISNTFLFMVGGYETIGSTLGFCIYSLVENIEVQEKLRDEINNHLYEKEVIDYSVLTNLQYMDQVLAEVSRLYPTYFPAVNRVCSTEFRYKDVIIPKNSVVTVPLWYLHRNPEYWLSPEKFMPERFSTENRSKIDPFVYQPFGAGPRICIGMRLAQIIVKYTIVHLLKSYRLEKADDNEELQLNFELVFVRPKKNLLIRAIPLQ